MRTLVLTFLGLLLLLTMTVWVSTLELGPVTLVISLTISLAKMVLILVFFMHLRSSGALMTFLACAGFIWLALLFALSFDDYAFRPGHADTRAPSVEERPCCHADAPVPRACQASALSLPPSCVNRHDA